MSNEKIIELLRKLKILSEKGENGERENAQEKLMSLAQKHGINLGLIEDESLSIFDFIVKKNQKDFFNQVVASVFNKDSWRCGYKRNEYYLECTKSQAIEIQAKFDFYWAEYEKEMDILYKAFVQKNRLFPISNKKEEEQKELTQEEKEELIKVFRMMESIDKKSFHKKLSTNK